MDGAQVRETARASLSYALAVAAVLVLVWVCAYPSELKQPEPCGDFFLSWDWQECRHDQRLERLGTRYICRCLVSEPERDTETP